MKILIVDDNANDRRLLRASLEHYGCEVIEAADGQEGLDLAHKYKSDVIISDALMPRMDGFQFLRAIKTDEGLESIPFIFYSATYTGTDEVRLATSLGAEAFIIKPKDPQEFWEELLGILEEYKLKKGKNITAELIEEEEEFLRKYSHIVAAKLEEKVRDLEKAKAEVEAKRAEWEATFDSIGDAITIHDKEFNVIMANKAGADLLGLSREEIMKKKCYELFHGKSGQIEGCPMVKTLESGKSNEVEIFEPHLDRWLSVSCFPLFDTGGQIKGVIHYAKDVTEKKKSEQMIKNILESVDEGFIVIDPDYRIISANRAYCELCNAKPEDIIGRHCYEVSHHIDKPCFMADEECAPRHTFKTGVPHTALHTHYDKENNLVYVETKSFPMKDSSGKVFAVIETMNNITEKRKLEDQLRHAQKMEAMGTLVGGVAHDFNNMLNIIIGYAGLMEMRLKQGDPMGDQVKEILKAGDRAAQLTRALLTFSRKQVLEMKTVNINEIVEGFKKMLTRIMGEDVELRIVTTDQDLTTKADIGQIDQVLMNLAANARDAMQKGGSFTIETKRTRIDRSFIKAHGYGEPGVYALITVSDTGTGMDEKTRERIFEPYFTTKEMGRGTGLGLAIIYGIVTQHNGYIHCYSEPGKGTTFRVYIPLIKTEAEKIEMEEALAPKGGTETILIAEDDVGIRKFAITLLEEFGYTVIEAVDGQDAVNKFKADKNKIQLLLFDLIMPKKNGKDAYDEIKTIRKDISVIFMSGYARDIIQRFGIEEGVEFISKPVLPTELLRKVREELDK